MSEQTIIIGGGISGITAAVELAEAGRQVVLVEKESYLGGMVAKLHNYFPKLCPPSCGLEINYSRIRSNPRITYYTGAEVLSICGAEGDFRVKVKLAPRMINNNCTACGLCAEACPGDEKAIFIGEGIAFPMKYSIDPELCPGDECGRCLELCEYDAIQLTAVESEIQLDAKDIILATGWMPYDASRIENYNYASEPDVIRNMELEQLMADSANENRKLSRPSDGKIPASIAFVQCAGSRDENHLPYCSAVCCPASVKHVLTLAENYPEIRTEIFYIDMRFTGRNEKLLARAESSKSITLTKGKVGRIEKEGESLVLEVEDIMAGKKRKEAFDMIVLATGIVPPKTLPGMALNEFGFYMQHQQNGIYPAATAIRPMDVSTSVKDATAAALKTMGDRGA